MLCPPPGWIALRPARRPRLARKAHRPHLSRRRLPLRLLILSSARSTCSTPTCSSRLTCAAEMRSTCGQVIGAIGESGNALNPHLHLEVRLGPAGVRFPGMAHYDSGASPDEMAAYCQWRVSGAFLTLDPLRLFQP